MNCRHCGMPLALTLIDLGSTPPSNAYLRAEDLQRPETTHPLRVLVCENCWLAQTEDHAAASDLFAPDYAYLSSYSTSWLQHAAAFVAYAESRFALGPASLVAEIAANDGYLLQYVRERGIPCYGVEPTALAAGIARGRGIDIVERFFGSDVARELLALRGGVDLAIANNVLAHVPDINDFVAGFAILLKPQGVASFEFPHLLRLLSERQFDTIYHEHYSYLSLHAARTVFAANGLAIFDVEELPTHGGSLRVLAQRSDEGQRPPSARFEELLTREQDAGICTAQCYAGLQRDAETIRAALLNYLRQARADGIRVAAYGAAAKGNTLLNFSRIGADLLPYVVDRNPSKQGMFLPGSRIPIVDESRLRADRPDRVLILPWNLQREIREQLSFVRDWGGRFVVAVPDLRES